MMRIAILMTCYNRREVTIRCLQQVKKLRPDIDIFLVDDNSTDGTSQLVKQKFKSVNLIKGNGNLFWNRGMLKAWETAYSRKDFDAYIWLNDDVELYDYAFEEIIQCAEYTNFQSIICGAFEYNNTFSYGGRNKKMQPLIPNGQLQDVFYLNGNFVFVPKYAFERIGMLDNIYVHHKGDYDYGLKARQHNIKVFTTKRYVGTCTHNEIIDQRSRKVGVSLLRRFQILYSPVGNNPINEFIFQMRYFGLFAAIKIYLFLHFINLLPDTLYMYLRSKYRNETKI